MSAQYSEATLECCACAQTLNIPQREAYDAGCRVMGVSSDEVALLPSFEEMIGSILASHLGACSGHRSFPHTQSKSVQDGDDKLTERGVIRTLLTVRERQVLDYLLTGMTDRQIARRLDIRPATVDSHVRKIRAKYRAPNRCALAASASRDAQVTPLLEWVPDEPDGRGTKIR